MTQNNNLENIIKDQFDELASDFPDEVDPNDFRVNVIMDFFGNIRGKKVLDVGCGKGRFSKIMIEKGADVTGVDISEELIRETKKILGGKFFMGSAMDLQFPDECFDLVYSVEVIEHVPDVEKAISEMVRVLKKEGKIVLIDKNKYSLLRTIWKCYRERRNKWMYPKDFQFRERLFSPWGVKRLLLSYFDIVNICYLGDCVPERRKTLYGFALTISNMLCKAVPFTSYYLAWLAEKRK